MTEIVRGASRARQWLRDNGLPYSDEITLEASGREFADGGHQRVQRVALCMEYLNKSNVAAKYISALAPERCVPVAV